MNYSSLVRMYQPGMQLEVFQGRGLSHGKRHALNIRKGDLTLKTVLQIQKRKKYCKDCLDLTFSNAMNTITPLA